MRTSERAGPAHLPDLPAADPSSQTTYPNGTSRPLAKRLLAAGIPVVVCTPCPGYSKPGRCSRRGHDTGNVELHIPAGWHVVTADECDVSSFRLGTDTLAMVGGHGLDLVDVDTKAGGSVAHLPPFKSYGRNRTPSGGRHYAVPSSGMGKVSPFDTVVGHVGDYVGGRPDGSGRLLGYLPGSSRPKYPRCSYTEEVGWDIDACLAADPDPALVGALEASGAVASVPEDYADDSPLRPESEGVHPTAGEVVQQALARLDALPPVWSEGDHWDDTHFEVACVLHRVANSNWTGYTAERGRADFEAHARTDEAWGAVKVDEKWRAAADAVGRTGIQRPSTPAEDFTEPLHSAVPARFPRMSLSALLDPNRPEREYVVQPMIAAGTSTALVAPAGHRKSLLLLGLALAVARGDADFAGMTIPKPRRVMYVDMENTEDDLRERLLSFGVTPHDDLDRFILVSLPPMEPLDTAQGGRQCLEAVEAYGLAAGDVVVLDSYQRITEAGENDSDTTRGFYRHTGVRLKALGLTVIRTDNTGKDVRKGARGSSGKRDDVDVEYLLQSDGDYIEIATGKARQRGVPRLAIYVSTDEEGRTTFRSDLPTPTARRAVECVETLDRLGVPRDAGERRAQAALAKARDATPRAVVREAVALRKSSAEDFASAPFLDGAV